MGRQPFEHGVPGSLEKETKQKDHAYMATQGWEIFLIWPHSGEDILDNLCIGAINLLATALEDQ